MIEFIEQIQKYLNAVELKVFLSDRMLIDAVARNFELIGEASAHVPDAVKQKYPDVPWAEMRGLCIVLAHNYMGADASVLWKTAQERLPDLKYRLMTIKSSEPES